MDVDSGEALAPSDRLECSDWAHRQRHGGQGSGGAAFASTVHGYIGGLPKFTDKSFFRYSLP